MEFNEKHANNEILKKIRNRSSDACVLSLADENTRQVVFRSHGAAFKPFRGRSQMRTINGFYQIKASIIGMTAGETKLSDLIPKKHENITI